MAEDETARGQAGIQPRKVDRFDPLHGQAAWQESLSFPVFEACAQSYQHATSEVYRRRSAKEEDEISCAAVQRILYLFAETERAPFFRDALHCLSEPGSRIDGDVGPPFLVDEIVALFFFVNVDSSIETDDFFVVSGFEETLQRAVSAVGKRKAFENGIGKEGEAISDGFVCLQCAERALEGVGTEKDFHSGFIIRGYNGFVTKGGHHAPEKVFCHS